MRTSSGVAASVLAAALCAATVSAQPRRQNILEFVAAALDQDKGLTPSERSALLDALRARFADYGFQIVPKDKPQAADVALRMIGEGTFDQAPPDRIADVAFAAYQAVSRGADPEVAAGLGLYGYRKKVSADRISLWANGYGQMTQTGVPAPVAADVIRNAVERDWDDASFDIVKWAMVDAVKKRYPPTDYAVYLLGHLREPGARPGDWARRAQSEFARARAAGRKPELPPYKPAFSLASLNEPSAPPRRAEKTSRAPTRIPERPAPARTAPERVAPAHGAPERAAEPGTAMSGLWPRLEQSAMSYLGTPYVWGGETHEGIDCSALTRNSYGENRVRIPRVSRDQWNAGTIVSGESLAHGDLVFFNTLGVGVSHVGMIVDPRGPRFIHASSSHGVTLADLSRPYYKNRYLGARRIIP